MSHEVPTFIQTVTDFWQKSGRHELPWRKTPDPYAILVSEIMLQQTQVDRVIPYFEKWMRTFPTAQALARVPLANVLRAWSGLGYNRRAKLLRECAKEIVARHGGAVPRDRVALMELPGIGPYTAGAVRVFAFNEPEVLIETNIRSAVIHHFYPRTKNVDDKEIYRYIGIFLEEVKNPREWYSALMDYGTHLKKTNQNPSRRSKHHVRQSRFEGSLRQARGAILRQLLKGPISEKAFLKVDVESSYRLELALRDLEHEELIKKRKGKWYIA